MQFTDAEIEAAEAFERDLFAFAIEHQPHVKPVLAKIASMKPSMPALVIASRLYKSWETDFQKDDRGRLAANLHSACLATIVGSQHGSKRDRLSRLHYLLFEVHDVDSLPADLREMVIKTLCEDVRSVLTKSADLPLALNQPRTV